MRRLIAVPTVLFALAAAGCGSDDDGGESTAPSRSAGPGSTPDPESSPAVPGQPVSCGEISDALGDARDVALFADPGAGGTVGCEEAHDVMSEFFLRAPQEAGGDLGSLAIRGWFCQYESGPTGTWLSTCRKDKLEMHTEASGEQPAPSDQPGGPEEPDSPEESQLPSLPDETGDPMEEPSTEEL
ncbi:hypothetical protein FCH28_31140 [Streptomyces piniterrae]|uniref:Uncharacterized protein n=1 Tax=Streptomyces piniterrae TaxID=2571125 RepID=A0A4U0MTQ7_9ACTN|nr:hypothetical protein [Streptomyces piniterrae]TJZ44066.1 hypothetical protein FCH28_31140 [Streptomyces piniterrae]